MEIEVSKKPQIQAGKRRYNQFFNHFQLNFDPLTKKVKFNVPINDTYHLSNLEKSFIYLQGAMGNESTQIASVIRRDPRSVQSFLKNVEKSSEGFSIQNKNKGRWPKGAGKLDAWHKEFLNKWIQAGTLVSARDAYLKLNSIKNIKQISYNPVRTYLKSLGELNRN